MLITEKDLYSHAYNWNQQAENCFYRQTPKRVQRSLIRLSEDCLYTFETDREGNELEEPENPVQYADLIKKALNTAQAYLTLAGEMTYALNMTENDLQTMRNGGWYGVPELWEKDQKTEAMHFRKRQLEKDIQEYQDMRKTNADSHTGDWLLRCIYTLETKLEEVNNQLKNISSEV